MGRNSKSSNKRNPMCEKLLKALGLHPKIVKFDPSEQIHVHEPNAASDVEKKQKPNRLVGDHGGQIFIGIEIKEGKKSGQDVNDVFSDYINRAKRRLGSTSSKRHDSSSRGKENLKDDRRFSDYIVRARNKLKATSSTVRWTKDSSIK